MQSAKFAGLPLVALLSCVAIPALAQAVESSRFDHFVTVQQSEVPSLQGQGTQLYVRERVLPATLQGEEFEGKVVLFIHGSGTPAEVAFDVPVPGYSWMDYLAVRGFDTFAMDMSGYGPSTRPPEMADRCNLSAEQQVQEFGDSCAATYPDAATTMASDWHDIDAVVEHLKQLRGVERVHLVGWSQGGPRAAGYAALHPAKVGNIVLLAPAYNRALPATAEEANIPGVVMTKQSRTDFLANWDRQVGCENQYDPAVAEVIWAEMLASDPVGATWGSGVRRAPRTPTFGWTPAVVATTLAPVLSVAGTHDAQVSPERVREFHGDLGSERKVYIEMHCASHNAMWEKDAGKLFDASWQWLSTTSYEGQGAGRFDLE